MGAITEEELTEVGAEGGLQGKSEIQGCAQHECWSHQPKQSSVEGDWHGGRNACLPEYLSFWEGVGDHWNTRERLGARGAEASGVGLGNLHQSPEEPIHHLERPLQDVLRWSRAGAGTACSFRHSTPRVAHSIQD